MALPPHLEHFSLGVRSWAIAGCIWNEPISKQTEVELLVTVASPVVAMGSDRHVAVDQRLNRPRGHHRCLPVAGGTVNEKFAPDGFGCGGFGKTGATGF